ncbi:nucleoside hydrolase [Anaeropeptidivorans aminofermentans]|jgi:pyrimidine-specific ribonucleoside hydrolase|uniref:nucleoside hydrolase n=1 Tax=Anaeropeptidivorans aminofermentans TaxID=2934315 RepID=UPI0020246655|nr:nucleoside hydrolase [Anaeropeptidivorans aminofermentans]MBE6012549.1 nucleoside hydrolase [Lachnospiraceae bacterium]
MEKKIPVIIDTDPGIDDAVALMVAFTLEELDIKAVITVAGNVGIEKVTANARTVLSTLGVKSKIYKGARRPLLGKEVIEAPEAHGVSGLGAYSIPAEKFHPLEAESGLEAYKRILSEAEEPVTIIAVGPLTNIAILLSAYPELKSKIKQISVMGGGLYTGNHTPAAEFNILADPEAAEIVYGSGIPIIMAGLDVTHQANIYAHHVEEIRAVGTPVSDMIATILSFYFDNFDGPEKATKCVSMHDTVSVLAVVYPELFEGETLHVVVETGGKYCRGYTLADRRKPGFKKEEPNCLVLMKLDTERVIGKIIEAVKSYA